jgi:hypothetical protein
MTDHIPNDLSHLSNAEFNSLCPQGEHAPGPQPLSPAAQAVASAYDDRQSISPVLAKQPVAVGECLQEVHPFVVRHYTNDERPSIKGNGFDGLEIGEDRQEAEEFIAWINKRICRTPEAQP